MSDVFGRLDLGDRSLTQWLKDFESTAKWTLTRKQLDEVDRLMADDAEMLIEELKLLRHAIKQSDAKAAALHGLKAGMIWWEFFGRCFEPAVKAGAACIYKGGVGGKRKKNVADYKKAEATKLINAILNDRPNIPPSVLDREVANKMTAMGFSVRPRTVRRYRQPTTLAK